ncbi:MAG: hypothetical protein RMM16_07750 [Chloroherpetonaceae bacterium]|nr:hypothetical protein [Chloroherpetonaceae bacterium]
MFATFAVAFAVAFIVDALFKSSLDRILKRIISDDIYVAWTRYVRFALYVVGVSSGVKMWDLERYVEPRQPNETAPTLELTTERWVLEIYRAIIETLQGVAWMLLIFFVFALIAYVIARIAESRREKKE